VVGQLDSVLEAHPVPCQIPMGAENGFVGVVDLVSMTAVTFPDGEVTRNEIPAELRAEALAWRTRLLEKLAEYDDELAERYLAEQDIPETTVREVLRRSALRSLVTPVLCGSAYRNIGIQPLLDAVVQSLPSPLDKGAVPGHDPDDPERVHPRHPSATDPFAGLAFKVIHDPYVGQQTFVRTYSGTLAAGDVVLNATTGKKERISRILRIKAKDRVEIPEVGPGDIAALIGLKSTYTGHTLCSREAPVVLESVRVPEPVISVKLASPGPKEAEKLHRALRKLALEDPSFTVRQVERTAETVIFGMGELHLEIIVDRLETDFGVVAEVGRPSVEYRETITHECVHAHRLVKQTGGRGQYAHTIMRLEPDPDGGFEFSSSVVGGAIPSQFIPAVRKGIEDVLAGGVLADFRVVGLRVVLLDGSAHEVDSSEMAFRACARACFREAFLEAGPRLLEPVMSVEIATPDEYIGDLVGDLRRRRGKVHNMRRFRKGSQKIEAEAPLAALFGYATAVRSLSSGRANHSVELRRFAALPDALMSDVLAEAERRKKGG
jgi:elongation factor G